MPFFIISNGAGRLPHVEIVDTHEDVVARLETDSLAFVVIEGRLIDHYEERILIVDSNEVLPLSEEGVESYVESIIPRWPPTSAKCAEVEPGDVIPRWPAAPAREAEHTRDVGEHPQREADNPPGNSTDKGPDDKRDGEVSDGSDDDDGELQRSDSVVPPTE